MSSLACKQNAPLGKTGGTGRRGDNELQLRRDRSAVEKRRASENNATKNVTNGGIGRSPSAGARSESKRSGRAAQKIPMQKQADAERGIFEVLSPSGVGATRSDQKLAKSATRSTDNLDTGVTMTMGSGWLDGLSSLVGLRPPTSIELPPPASASDLVASIPKSVPNSAPARLTGAGTIDSWVKIQEEDHTLQKEPSSMTSTARPSSLKPPPKKRTTSSVTAKKAPPRSSPSSSRRASKPNGSPSPKEVPSQVSGKPTSEPFRYPKNDQRRSLNGTRSKTRPSSANPHRPIKLISATNRPTIASLSSNISRHRSVASTTKSKSPGGEKGRRKRHRRQISGEVIAALERDVFSDLDDDEEEGDDNEDVMSVKETLIEGLKTWKPAFLRSSPPLARHSGNRRHRHIRHDSVDRYDRRRRQSVQFEIGIEMQRGNRPSTHERSKSLSRHRQRHRQQERHNISATERTASSASTETSRSTNKGSDYVGAGNCNGHGRLSKREELERTMNAFVGCPAQPGGPLEKKGKNPTLTPQFEVRGSSPTPSPFFKSKATTPTSLSKIDWCGSAQQKPTKTSPARSTESSRTVETIPMDEESPASTPSRLSSSDCPEDLEAGQENNTPRLKGDETPPLDFPTKEEEQQRKLLARQRFYANNFAVFAHGRITTIIPVMCAGIALILSVVARRSTNFVHLQVPLLISPTFDRVDRVGLVFLELCLADEITTVAEGSGIETKIGRDYRGAVGRSSPHLQGTGDSKGKDEGGFSVIGNLLSLRANPTSIEEYDQIIEDYDHDDYIFVGPSDDGFETDMAGWDEQVSVVRNPKICRSIKITSSTLTDSLWHVSRTFLSLAIGFGFFLSFFLVSSAYWSTINLKPVAVGLLLTYFFQSMTFFFFDSSICREHNCKMSSGAASAVVASIFWFAAALGTIWMDMVFVQKKRRRERQERRKRRRERQRKRRREARAAFEALKKKAALDLTEASESVSVCSSFSSDVLDGNSDVFDDEDDEWIENFLHEDNCSEESLVHDSTDIYNAISFR